MKRPGLIQVASDEADESGDGVRIVPVGSPRGSDAEEFIRFPHRLYAGCDQWVPWFDRSIRDLIARRHPYFDHSDAEFFIARDGEETVGRIVLLENRRFNEKHGERACCFYFYDVVDRREVTRSLFAHAQRWARARGLDRIVGPMLFGAVGGQGLLVEGFEHRAAMTMMGYHYPYYRAHLEAEGFTKRKDYLSFQADPRTYVLPERIARIAEVTMKRGRFEVRRYRSRRDLRDDAALVGAMYNEVLASFNEGPVLTDREVARVVAELLSVVDPRLIKILARDSQIVGFLLTYPDLSEAMQRCRGRLGPISLIRLKRESSKTRRLIVNGMGILPEYQRLGGNALLYAELTRTAQEQPGRFVHADFTQIAESTDLMLTDLTTLGGEPYKRHRLYEKRLD
jgi:hypothetical protein